jgi:hypothetical protein
MGATLQSDQPALRVAFKGIDTKAPFQLSGDPYLRGATLTLYERGQGPNGTSSTRWLSWNPNPGRGPVGLERPLRNQADVLQDITLEAEIKPRRGSQRVALFSTFAAFADDETPGGVEIDYFGQQLVMEKDAIPNGGRQFRYAIRSGAFRGTVQSRLTRETRNFKRPQYATQLATLQPQLAQDVFPQLVAQAQRIVAQAQATDAMSKALALEAHFRAPGNYQYSLDPDVTRNRNLDPLEDFVANHRTGHCEYFASALVLMLRSQGIPARLVVGYKGGTFNQVGYYYQVRQRDAHAWAEVYLAPGEFPAEQLPDFELFGEGDGAWLRLDPTPADDDGAEDAIAVIPLLEQLGDAVDYLQILWTDYVLGLNSDKQRAAIYAPLIEVVSSFWKSLGKFKLSSPALSPLWLALLLLGLIALVFLWNADRYLSGARGALAQVIVKPVRWLRRWLGSHGPLAQDRPSVLVDFYQRLERILQAHGVRREQWQTQREFAVAAGGRLADVPQLQPVAGVPRRVVEAFYRVRFGGLPLDSAERLAVEQSLGDLEAALGTRQ